MNPDAEFVEHCIELLSPFDPSIRSKRMFGGHGIFCQALMFALVADGELYFKVDDESEAEFLAEDLPKFTYLRNGKKAGLNYRRSPESAFRNSEAMRCWFDLAWAAAIRADEAKPPSKQKRSNEGRSD